MHCRCAADIIRQRTDPVSQPASDRERTHSQQRIWRNSIVSIFASLTLQSRNIHSIYISSYIVRRESWACSDQTARAREQERSCSRSSSRSACKRRLGPGARARLSENRIERATRQTRVRSNSWPTMHGGRNEEIGRLSVRRTHRARLQLGGKTFDCLNADVECVWLLLVTVNGC